MVLAESELQAADLVERELQAADLAERELQTSVLAAPSEPDLEVPA